MTLLTELAAYQAQPPAVKPSQDFITNTQWTYSTAIAASEAMANRRQPQQDTTDWAAALERATEAEQEARCKAEEEAARPKQKMLI